MSTGHSTLVETKLSKIIVCITILTPGQKVILKRAPFEAFFVFHLFINKALRYCLKELYIKHYLPEYLQVCICNVYDVLLRPFWNWAVKKKPDQWFVSTTEMSSHPCVEKQSKFIIRWPTRPSRWAEFFFCTTKPCLELENICDIFSPPKHERGAKSSTLDTSLHLNHQTHPFWRLQSHLGKSDLTIWIGHDVR